MAGLILCRGKYADKPYHISNMSINIRSMEELCYYLYHNIYLVGQDLIDEGLIRYIETELEEPELASQLTFLTSQNAGFAEIIIAILRHVDFFSDQEIEQLRETIDKLDLQNASERLKSRADSFLKNRRYGGALRNYEVIVYGRRDPSLSMSFYGDVWHNMGVAYARMFYYKDAAVCFKTAYEMNQNENSQRCYVAAEMLAHNGSLEGNEEIDEQTYIISKEVETVLGRPYEEYSFGKIEEAGKLLSEGKQTEYAEATDRIIEDWKAEYKNFMV